MIKHLISIKAITFPSTQKPRKSLHEWQPMTTPEQHLRSQLSTRLPDRIKESRKKSTSQAGTPATTQTTPAAVDPQTKNHLEIQPDELSARINLQKLERPNRQEKASRHPNPKYSQEKENGDKSKNSPNGLNTFKITLHSPESI